MPVDAWAIDSLNFTGREIRMVESTTVMADGTVLGSRSGVRPGDPGLNVSLAGSTINVSPGVATVFQPAQGVYKVALGSTTSPGTLTPAHATLARVDLVYLRVWDNAVDASGLNQADPVYLTGIPSATPSAPVPAGTQIYMPLATISVPAAGGGSPTISTAVRPFTVAPGGILPSTTTPTGLYVGQYWDDGTNLRRWNGTGWDRYLKAPGASSTWTPAWTTTTGLHLPSWGNATVDCRYFKLDRLVMFNMNITFGSTTNFGSSVTTGDNWQFSLPFTSATTNFPIATAMLAPGTSRATTGEAITTTDGTGFFLNIGSGAYNNSTVVNAGVVDSLSPWTWASGNSLHVIGQYEAVS